MKLREYLAWKGIQKNQFAKKLGVAPSYISHLTREKSPRRCPIRLAERIEAATEGHVTRLELVWPE